MEYDNFTDEEEEMSSSNISSSKPETVTTQRAMSSHKISCDQKSSFKGQVKCDSKSEVSQSESQQNLPKRKLTYKINEYKNSKFKKSKHVDFDSIFNNHGNTGKYGFGFSRQEQLNLESEFYCSTSSHSQYSSARGSGDYKAISFVKSDNVFDLNTLNKDASNDCSSQSKPNENEPVNDDIYAPGPSGLNRVNKSKDSEQTVSKDSLVHNRDTISNEEKSDTSNFLSRKLNEHVNAKPGTSFEKKESSSNQKDVSSSSSLPKVNSDGYKVSKDLDEIHKQLSEAFDVNVSFFSYFCKFEKKNIF